MAIEGCSKIFSPGLISPTVSFFHDVNQANPIQVDNQHLVDKSVLDSNFDFNFCVVNNFKSKLSSADELFSNGKLLPIQIKTNPARTTHTRQPFESMLQIQSPVQLSCPEKTEKKRLKEFLSTNFDAEEKSEEKTQTKSFWQFRRSDSAGSVDVNSKPTTNLKETQKKNLQKQRSASSRSSSVSSSSSSSCSNSYYVNSFSTQKPDLRKSKSYGHGTRITPVLNIPPLDISKVTISFSGLSSFFCNSRVKKKNKK